MCGGRGRRLALPGEKPLVEIGGEPMIDRILASLAASRVEAVHAAVTPATPETRAHLDGRAHFDGR
ncbi:MAG: NTP transferase domain-containing protein, partial [Haloarculaceae archaeon]